MRIMKKLIAVISSLAVVATMASSMIAYAADGNPTFSLVKTEAASGVEGAYDISVRLDVTRDSELASYGDEFNNLLNFTVWLKLDGTFDTTSSTSPAYATQVGPITKYNNVATWDGFGKVTVNYDNGYIKVVRSDVTTPKAITAETNLVTFKNVKLADGVTTEDFDVSLDFALCGIGYDSSYQDSYKYVGNSGESVGSSTALTASDITSVTFPGNKTAGGNEEPEITQDVITTDDAEDAAVYAYTEIAGATGQKLTVVANRNNEAEDITRTFTLPAKVEATVSVGIVVQYNPQNITSFTIKSMTIGE